MIDLFDLSGRIAVVTGANTGIGQAIAVALASAGADLVLAGRSQPGDTVQMIGDLGRRSRWVHADLATLEPVDRIVDETVQVFGRLDVLVNNAGIIRRADAIDVTEEDWDNVLHTNLKVPFFLAQAAARAMVARGAGKIINVASLLSFQGGIRVPSYTASKSGLAGITKGLANEWAGKGINVNAIAPGYFETHNTEQLRSDPERSKAILERIPAGRWGHPRDVAGAAIFLASSASDYVNGHILAVDGGWLAR
jgi:2-deoxy-D-gluconate 3-dehydrogenase